MNVKKLATYLLIIFFIMISFAPCLAEEKQKEPTAKWPAEMIAIRKIIKNLPINESCYISSANIWVDKNLNCYLDPNGQFFKEEDTMCYFKIIKKVDGYYLFINKKHNNDIIITDTPQNFLPVKKIIVE